MKDYDAYLFDMDGTLTQTLPMWLPIVRNTLEEYDLQATDKQITLDFFGRARQGLLDYGVPEADLAGIFKQWDKIAQKAIVEAPLYPRTKEMLAMLRERGKKTALITATIRPTTQKALDAHGIGDLFDVVMTGDELPAHKPDPRGLYMAMERLGVAKPGAVMLGDSDKDIGAAHNAGIDSVLFFPPGHHDFHTRDELLAGKPTYVIGSWQELLDQLR